MKTRTIHLKIGDHAFTVCGIVPAWFTYKKDLVTCKKCLKIMQKEQGK